MRPEKVWIDGEPYRDFDAERMTVKPATGRPARAGEDAAATTMKVSLQL